MRGVFRGGNSRGFGGRGSVSNSGRGSARSFAPRGTDLPRQTATPPTPEPITVKSTRKTFDDESRVEQSGATHSTVQTFVNDHGSEVPQRLNNKVFIDGLPYTYKPEPGQATLEEELSQFVQDWKVGKVMKLLKRDGQGFGYLAFRSPNSVDVAVRVLNGRKFLGRALRVEVPKPKQLDELNDSLNIRDQGKTSFARQVLLSDLAKISQPEIIREILRDVAPQLEEKIETIKMTSSNRKAFVTLKSEDDVEQAVRFLNGLSMLGRNISAHRALAPGSLPYSRAPAPLTKVNTSGNSTTKPIENSKVVFDDCEDDESIFVPLGANTSNTRPTSDSTTTDSKKKSSLDLYDKGSAEIYVGNLSEEVTESQLRHHFAQCGAIKSCEILVNPNTRASTGVGRIEFVIPAYAKYAVDHLHGSRLARNTLRVDRGDEANPESNQTTIVSTNDDDDYDEDAYLKHHGVRNKSAYFRGTSIEESFKGDKKRLRDQGKDSLKAAKTDDAKDILKKQRSVDQTVTDNDDEDDDEHFDDVDAPKRRVSARMVPRKKFGRKEHINTVDF